MQKKRVKAPLKHQPHPLLFEVMERETPYSVLAGACWVQKSYVWLVLHGYLFSRRLIGKIEAFIRDYDQTMATGII